MALALSGTYVQECLGPETELIVKIRNTIFGPGLWVVAAGASALSLGSGSGTVVLGSPVDLAFELQPDPGTDVASSCVTAKLVAGDNAVADSKVRVMPLPEVRGRPSGVRVMASIALDEPVLTVTLTAGCAGKTTRTYTFLSDLPTIATRSASALPVDLSRLPGAAGAEAARPAPRAQDSRPVPASPDPRATPQPLVPRAPAAARPVAPATATPPVRPAARVPAPAKASAAAPASRPRLVIEPLDIWLDSPVPLRSSPELSATPSEEMSPQRAQAIALWKALNAQPEALLKDSEQLKSLESEAAALRAQAAKDRAAAAQLQQQLELVEQERFPATIVYALGALLALALLVAAWMWMRLRKASQHAVRAWGDSVALGSRDTAAAEEALGLTRDPGDSWLPSDTQPVPDEDAPSAAGPSAPVTVPAPSPVPVVAAAARPPLVSAPVPLPSPAAASASLHIVNPEELFDIQQQAEFFISVGEHQQAIEVLKNHIAEHRETSPLAYLELLRLYHTLSRVDEFAQLRAQFMQSFNAQVPEFSGFHRTGRMLYHYTDALADIEALWTSPEVLGLLETLLFRRTGAESVEPFDLAAYDDLLLLLSIAQTTPASVRGEPPPRKRTTPLAPPRVEALVAESMIAPAPVSAELQRDDAPLDSLAASLEFDFGAMPPRPAAGNNNAPVATAPAAIGTDSGHAPLDLDLSEPLHLTLSDLPPVPVTPPPPSGQAVGFGMENDLMELRLELEQMKHKTDRSK